MAWLNAQPAVLTWHNDNARTGQTLAETILQPGNVNQVSFGKLFTISVDGKVDAEPLYVPSVPFGAVLRNVLVVATENDSVYAFDADTGAVLWQASMLLPGETTSEPVYGCGQVSPQIGVTSTPVIDPAAGPNGAVYVVAMSKDSQGHYIHRIHALDLMTKAELFGGPVTIQASYTFPGNNHTVTFDPKQYKERAALLLLDGVVYTSWASHCDVGFYTAWVIGHDQYNLQRVNVIDLTPNGNDGAVWASGAGPAADPESNIYFLMANGTFDTTLDLNGFPNLGDYGNAFMKLSSTGRILSVADYFTMDNADSENASDTDLGSGGAMLLPPLADSQGHMRDLAVGAGKDGNLYVVDRAGMGKFNPSSNQIYQQLSGALPGGIWSAPAWFNGSVYYGSVGNHLQAFPFANGSFTANPVTTSASFGYPGATPGISANGSSEGIVWVPENSNPAVLHAYRAEDLSTELFNSNQASGGRDHFGAGNKFMTPTIANGKVYVGTTNGIGVFGLLNCSYVIDQHALGAPASGIAGSIHVTTTAGCLWGSSIDSPFITVSGGSGNGDGTLSYTVLTNDTGAPRSGHLMIGGQTLTVSQSGGGDFSGDTKPDVIWQNDTTRQTTVWYMGGAQGTTFLGWNYLSGDVSGWTLVGAADVDGDGHPDLIWQNDTTRQTTVWYMGGAQGTTFLGWNYLGGPEPGWRVVGMVDFNGDKHPDLVWQNDTTRQVTVWYMGGAQGNTLLSWNYLSGQVTGWKVVGVADFNGDGHPDLIWQNDASRQATVWYMGGASGASLLGWDYLAGSERGWRLAGVADFNGDGHPDLIWQNDTTRQSTAWYMGGAQGTMFLGWNYISGEVDGWKIVAPR